MASAATVVTGVKGYTFNAAGLHPNTVARAPYNVSAAGMAAKGKLIDAYHSTADPLTNLQSGFGALQEPFAPLGPAGPLRPLVPPGGVSPEALGIPHTVTPAAQWRHEWGELVRHNPLTTSKNMALDGHGVDPQLVDHIEDQKDQDTATLTQFVVPAL